MHNKQTASDALHNLDAQALNDALSEAPPSVDRDLMIIDGNCLFGRYNEAARSMEKLVGFIEAMPTDHKKKSVCEIVLPRLRHSVERAQMYRDKFNQVSQSEGIARMETQLQLLEQLAPIT